MPWELLYDKSSRMFYAQSDRTPVVRYLDVINPPRPLTVQGPLRILAIIASPHGLPRLDVEREWATICDALADKERDHLVHVDRLRAPTIAQLQRWLRHNEVHVLHFVGHGYFARRRFLASRLVSRRWSFRHISDTGAPTQAFRRAGAQTLTTQQSEEPSGATLARGACHRASAMVSMHLATSAEICSHTSTNPVLKPSSRRKAATRSLRTVCAIGITSSG